MIYKKQTSENTYYFYFEGIYINIGTELNKGYPTIAYATEILSEYLKDDYEYWKNLELKNYIKKIIALRAFQ